MGERINRRTDENLYQPKIHSDRVRELYLLKEISGLPMTVLVDTAIKEFIANHRISEEVLRYIVQNYEGQSASLYGWINQAKEVEDV